MQDLRNIRRQLELSQFAAARAELDNLRRRRNEQGQPTSDVDSLQEEIESARQGFINQQISEANRYAVSNQWERVLTIVNQITDLESYEERALNLRQQANEALRKLAESRSIDDTIVEARRRVTAIRSRQDAILAINFIEPKIGPIPHETLTELLAQAHKREREIRERENVISTMELRNNMAGLLQELEKEYQKGSTKLTLNGQERDLVSYLPQVRAMVRTASEERANEYMQRAKDRLDEQPTKALELLKEALEFPELQTAKQDQINEQIELVSERVKQWNKAVSLVDEAYKLGRTPADALAHLNQARGLAPTLPNLIDQIIRLRLEVANTNIQQLVERQFVNYRIAIARVRQQEDYKKAEAIWQKLADVYDETQVLWAAIRAEGISQSSLLVQDLADKIDNLAKKHDQLQKQRLVAQQTLDTLDQVRVFIKDGDLTAADQGLQEVRKTGVLTEAIKAIEDLLASRKGAEDTERLARQRKDEGDYNKALELAGQLPSPQRDLLLRTINSARVFAEAESAYSEGNLSIAKRKYNEVLNFKGEEQSRASERLAEIEVARKADAEIETRLKNARLSIKSQRYKEGIDALSDLLKLPSSFHDEIIKEYSNALPKLRESLKEIMQAVSDDSISDTLTKGFNAASTLQAYFQLTGDERHTVNRIQRLYYTQCAKEAERQTKWREAQEHWIKVIAFDPQAVERAQIADQHAVVIEAGRDIAALAQKLENPLYRNSLLVMRSLINLCMAERRLDDAQKYTARLRELVTNTSEVEEIEQRISQERIYQSNLTEIKRRYSEQRYFEAVTMLEKLIQSYPEQRLTLEAQRVEWRNRAITELEKKTQTQSDSALSRYLACQQIALFGHDTAEMGQRKNRLDREARVELDDLLQRVARQINTLGEVEMRTAQKQLGEAQLAFEDDRNLAARITTALELVVPRLNEFNTMVSLLDEVARLMGQNRLEEANSVMKNKIEERYAGRQQVAEMREEINIHLGRRRDQLNQIEILRDAFQKEEFEKAVQALHKLRTYPHLTLQDEDRYGVIPWRDPKTRETLTDLVTLEQHWQNKQIHHRVAVELNRRLKAEFEQLHQRYHICEQLSDVPPATAKAQIDDLLTELRAKLARWEKEFGALPESMSSSTDTIHGQIEDLLNDDVPALETNLLGLSQRAARRDRRIAELDIEIEERINSGLFDNQTQALINEALALDSNNKSFLQYEHSFNQHRSRNDQPRRPRWPFGR